MPRAMSPLQLQLQTEATLDAPARQAALIAVNNMMSAATRSGSLLAAARQASMAEASGDPSVAKGRAALIAQDAYQSAISAEVAKYRAAYAIMAEEHGNHYVTFARAASQARTAQHKQPLIQKAKFHGKARDIMMQASAATEGALKNVPPLPMHITGQLRTNQQVAKGGGEEYLAQPTFGWRPQVYKDLTGNFFPKDIKNAAGALNGALGGIGSLGLVGAASLGTVDATQGYPTGNDWWLSLQRSIGFGLDAAGKAALDEGQKKANSDPSTAGALKTGGSIMSVLSNLLTGGVQQGMEQPVEQSVSWGLVLGVGAVAALGGWLVWKHMH